MNAEKCTLSFVNDNIVFYKFTNGGKRITKTSNGWTEGVYVNRFITDLPTFSVKIMQLETFNFGIYEGVEVDSSHYTLQLYGNSWCYYGGRDFGYIIDHLRLTPTGVETPPNSTVTVSVNLENKTISYKIDGKSVGTPQSVKLVDSEFLLLRPIVQMEYVGDSVEIYP